MNDLESAEKISIDIKKLERNLKQVEDINFEGKEKEVYDRAVDYMNDSKYYLEKKKDMRTFLKIRYGILGQTMNIPGKSGRKISSLAYSVARRIVGFN